MTNTNNVDNSKELEKAFDFELNVGLNEIEISKDVYSFVRKLHIKSRLDKDIFIQKKSNNFDISNFLLLMNEINLAFTKIENELDANDNILNNGKLPNTNEVKKHDKNQRKRDALKLAKIDWKSISKDYYIEIRKKIDAEPVKHSKDNFTFKNNFNSMQENKVIEYFYPKLVEKKYITEATFYKFLENAFDKETLLTEKLNFENPPKEKKVLITIFYNFYKMAGGYGKKDEYINLLYNYFNGYELQKLKNNFRD